MVAVYTKVTFYIGERNRFYLTLGSFVEHILDYVVEHLKLEVNVDIFVTILTVIKNSEEIIGVKCLVLLGRFHSLVIVFLLDY